MTDRITVNGVDYASIDDAPAEVRAFYEQGMAMLDAAGPGTTEMTQQSYTVNGQTYASLDEMPPELRASYQETMGSMDNMLASTPAPEKPDAPPPAPEPPRPNDPIYIDETDQSSNSGFAKGLVAGLIAAAAALAFYFFYLG
jgi:hypothetical protein